MLATGKHGYQNIRCALQHARPTIALQLLGFPKKITALSPCGDAVLFHKTARASNARPYSLCR